MLYLGSTQVSDLTPLTGLNSLQWLDLDYTEVSDLSPLAEIKSLNRLWLKRTAVTDEQVKSLQQALPNCKIY